MILTAISPRLAMRIFENTRPEYARPGIVRTT
jgi:hypothetical protein